MENTPCTREMNKSSFSLVRLEMSVKVGCPILSGLVRFGSVQFGLVQFGATGLSIHMVNGQFGLALLNVN